MNDINLNSMKSFSIFKTLYENGTASKTAKILGITQSGVSRSLSMLENNIGFSLFIREKKGLIATPEARELYKEVLRLTHHLEETKHSILALREFGASRFRIAAIPGLAFGYIPKLISKMLEINPKLNIYFDILSSNEIVQAVESDAFDIGFVTLPIKSKQLKVEPILKTKAVCVIPEHHPLAALEIIGLNDLKNCNLLIPNQPNVAADQLLHMISEKNIKLNNKTEANLASICSLVSNNVGVSVINPVTVDDLDCKNILIKPFTPEISYSFALVYKTNWQENKMIRIIKDIIQMP
ncbi:MAG: DNA-binding transcriptional LysR family regulator [Alteromonadaceae bacterium]|jgi:DNA-binding transcriptional LysR family regulator